jgi:hypothetical protein
MYINPGLPRQIFDLHKDAGAQNAVQRQNQPSSNNQINANPRLACASALNAGPGARRRQTS